ncbi:hypothetical protein NCAS_0D01070 [Naumovozyma castellii]|uniref:Enoyl reductase (ER) domain-containing protein n=1 Tax=Naumovozyma castellii TaxID=27288 RepID=G0VDP9_NAUCA|nr:hypothetical protein NCAS_0D01070 [Naumovozyma castellii CBS 4309]CCC69688.1 hypothetical protein NCAS_0D01070 [Naumovozyma castellii CBS 4309]
MSKEENIVTKRAVTFVNNATPATITETELDLNTCFKDNEIVISVEAAALNPVDFTMHDLAYPRFCSSQPKGYSRDYAGVMVRRGAKVEPKWQVGDKVNGLFQHLYGEQGTLANYLILNPKKQASIAHIPPTEDSDQNEFVHAAAWPLVFGSAYNTLFRCGQTFNEDSRILVNGASTAVSNAFIQIAKNQLHVGTVVGICNSASVERNKKLGFDYLVPYNQEGSITDNVEKLMKENHIGKFDLIFDSVGTSEFYPIMDRFLKPRSENSYYITLAGDEKMKYGKPTFSSVFQYKIPLRTYNPWRKFNFAFFLTEPRSDFMELGSRMIEKGTYVPPIDSIYKFDQFQEAIDRLKSNKAKGKVVVTIN